MPEKKVKTSHEPFDIEIKQTKEKQAEVKQTKETQANASKKTTAQEKKNLPKNLPSPQKTKQASLMSFFKKK